MRTYVVGDIHGHLDKLQVVHAFIAKDRARVGDSEAPIVHVGDFVDRGPDTRGVLDFLINGLAQGRPWVCLKGNHDRMMAAYLQPDTQRDPLREDLHWLSGNIGGRESLISYGVDASFRRPLADVHEEACAKVPLSHRQFLEDLPKSLQRGEVFFCHAGIRPGVALDAQTEDDLLWIRQEFHASTADHGALIVHGHTPIKQVTHYGNRLNVDTGAAWGHDLSAVVMEGTEVFRVTASGRAPVLPQRF